VKVEREGSAVTVRGPKGELKATFHPDMVIQQTDGVLTVSRRSDNRIQRSLHGLTRTLLANMIEGVNAGFQKSLEISGVGYRAQKVGEKLVLQVGFSHPVEVEPPSGITFTVEGVNRVNVLGVDKQLVGEVAARIRGVKVPDPYREKGIKYLGERIRRKAGKGGAKGGR
jgi:large subunit ribosomal protein L6